MLPAYVQLGTKINWTASLRTPDHVRREWASPPHGLAAVAPGSISFDNALDAVCSRLGVGKGTAMSGPNARLLSGLRQLGLHGEELPRNCTSSTCSAYCSFGCRSGHKQSSDVTWLVDAVRAGAHVITGVEAQRILTQPCQVRQIAVRQVPYGREALRCMSSHRTASWRWHALESAPICAIGTAGFSKAGLTAYDCIACILFPACSGGY
eukprot:GHRR01019248.1.p1 GENE.GHRR01019248.1~~GHRR01019248.1.p1  ORF type:complete len:209 (+),score=24.01 GHRR01019248.1:1276-1902(+)